MAANRDDVGHMPEIEKNSLVVVFKRVPARLVELYLRRILEKEGLTLSDEVIEKIVRYARGDVRAAVNALQAAATTGSFEAAYRDVQLTLRDAISEAASTRIPDMAYSILRAVDAQPQDKIKAVYSALSMSGIKDPRKLARAFRLLSEADMLYSRIIRTQNWKLLRYLDRILAASLSGTMATYSEYDAPYQVSSRVWNEGRVYRKIAEVMSKATHTSRKEFMTYYFEALVLGLANNQAALRHLSQMIGETPENLRSILGKEAERISRLKGR
jgi:replication factor C large subunit